MKKEVFIGEVAEDIVEEIPVIEAEKIADESGDNNMELPARAVRNDDGTVTLSLRVPVKVQVRDHTGNVRTDNYDKLTYRHLTGADLRAIQSVGKGQENIVAFARATNISEAVMNVLFDKMHIADINAGGEIMAAFMHGGQ